MHWADITVLASYLVGIAVLGAIMARRSTSVGEFFMPRRFGAFSMIMHSFGTGTGSDQAVSVAAATARNGLSGIWYQWLWLIPTPFYWLLAPIMRRFRAVTTADVLTLRFDQSVAVLFSIVGILGMAVKIGLMLRGAGEVIEASTGSLLNANHAIILITVLFVFYGMAGGLAAAIATDFVQGIMTIIFSFMLLPCVFSAVGGMAGVRQHITAADMLSLAAPGEISIFFIVMLGVQGLVGIVGQPHTMGTCAAGKTETEGRIGFMVGNLVKRLCTVAWCLTAIGAVAWYVSQGESLDSFRGNTEAAEQAANQLYGRVAREFLPTIMPGLLGVFLASLLAAIMSSCDSFMIASAALFTENVYKPAVPNRPETHYVWVGRLVSLFVVLVGIGFAWKVENVIALLEIWFKIAPMTGIAFWISLFWRRMTVTGAWASTLSGFTAWYVTTRADVIQWTSELPIAESWGLISGKPGALEIYQPWQILFYLTVASTLGIVVSLVTRPVSEAKLDRFYTLIRTPIGPNESITQACQIPVGSQPRPVLFERFGLVIPRPSRTSVLGFLGGWAAGAMLVLGFWWFVQN
ncbi:MAG: sodium:solute symporter family protein [Planctomycetales bacterium]|nr:sodium:solute symporter family protein [Planctomycetales bacterium]